MLWDECRPAFIVTLVPIVVLKKKVLTTNTRKWESGSGGNVGTVVHSTAVPEMLQYT